MTASEMVRTSLKMSGHTQTELAKFMGWSKQNLNIRLKNNSLTFDELAKALGYSGYRVEMTNADGLSLPHFGNSKSPRIVKMVDGVRYDTSKAESICDNRTLNIDMIYMELFRNEEGRFFMAYYQLCEGGRNMISPIGREAAECFIEKCTYGRKAPEEICTN